MFGKARPRPDLPDPPPRHRVWSVPKTGTRKRLLSKQELALVLELNGVETIYGVPGIPITDFGRMAQAAGIRVISFRHEQNAGNAAAIAGWAGAYARRRMAGAS